ncbi:hypothetical protein STRAU_0568 [Streptomyces aurantiacus JA 4570]|uniref:Uncharacterized protein n=1 Tax=Streptomyces aurantiacus JA 4570 TaxID=1286094 RepID=S3ZT16_9ACTN|nr:hypothetical protein STRAU_0568 [Streptomyces aurantiacus JA 4570]
MQAEAYARRLVSDRCPSLVTMSWRRDVLSGSTQNPVSTSAL